MLNLINSADNATLSFISSDAVVATVTETGIVSALKEGTAVIEMTLTVNGNTQKDTCTVNVVDRDVTFMDYQKDNVTLGINETITPSLIILPDNLEVTGIEYKIADSNIADVDINGAVTGKNEGQTVLTASYKNLQASINVIVTKNAVKVESISVNCPSTFLYQGDTFQLVPEILPVDAANKNVIYSSDNKDVAIVYPSGLITAQNSGSAVITAVTEDGEKTAQCSVTVNQASAPLESISIDDYMIENGTSKFIQVKVTPENAKFTGLKVQSSSDAVTITNAGRTLLLATAKKQGFISQITVEAENCEPASGAVCYNFFDIYTYDNNSASLPEYLSLVEPYNMIMPDGDNFKVYMDYSKGDTFDPLLAVNYMPLNSKIPEEDIEINTPDMVGNSGVIYYSTEDKLIHTNGTGDGVVEIKVLGNNKIKPVHIFVKVVANENEIPAWYKICPASSIVITNETELKYNLSIGSRPILVNASVNHQAGCLGGKVETYKIETSDKNIIDIIDGYAYAKKAGKAVITVISNSVYTVDKQPVKASVEIEVK